MTSARPAKEQPSGPSSGDKIVRLCLIGLCLLLSLAAFDGFRDWQVNRVELVALLRDSGLDVRNEAVIDRVQRERTPHHAKMLAARALVYDVLTDVPATAAAGDSPADRLPAVRKLARQVLGTQPNSWQAAMLLGAATYLERSLNRDRRLVTAAAEWEEPLLRAVREAPGRDEPRRFLVAAYLEVWPYLSPEKKDFARRLLRESFAEDPHAFRRLVPAWLEVAEDVDDAFAPIPERPDAWLYLEYTYAERREWDRFCLAHRRRLNSLMRQLEERLDEAAERLRLGDFYHGRSLLLRVISTAPRDLRFAPIVTRALERYPAGLHGLASTERLRGWLRWALELSTVSLNPLPPRIVGRLAGAAGRLDPPEAALAALIAGEIHHAERLERLTDTLTIEAWAPYLIAKSQWLLERDQPAQAAATLELVDRASRKRMAFWLASERLARARGELVDLAEAQRRLASFRSREWPALVWQWRGNRTLLWLLPEAPAAGLAVGLNDVPPTGAVVELRWDGRTVALQPVYADQDLELRLDVDTRPHLLELRMLAGGQVYPGRVRLRDLRSPDAKVLGS
ncbi:MAG: hypothetical protein GY856_09535 [bacterium]|nr:hypothetical protein [bacterium]